MYSTHKFSSASTMAVNGSGSGRRAQGSAQTVDSLIHVQEAITTHLRQDIGEESHSFRRDVPTRIQEQLWDRSGYISCYFRCDKRGTCVWVEYTDLNGHIVLSENVHEVVSRLLQKMRQSSHA